MHPKCFQLFPGRFVYWYGAMAALGFLSAMVHWSYLERREGRAPGFGSDLAVWLMLSGILGARLAYVLTNGSYFAAEPWWRVFRIDEGGLIFYGGLLGGCVGAAAFARAPRVVLRRVAGSRWAIRICFVPGPGLELLPLGDFIVTGIPLGHAFGRLGCFLNGCCHGKPWTGFLAVRFPAGSIPAEAQIEQGLLAPHAYASLPVHPAQLYEAAFNVLLYAVLLLLYRRHRGSGRTLGAYLIGYPVGRFLVELVRGDVRPHAFGLSINQWLCPVLAGLGLWLIRRSLRGGDGGHVTNCGA